MKIELTETLQQNGDDEYPIWHLRHGLEIFEINNVFEGAVLQCNWVGIDNKFLEVMYADWDGLELFAIMNLKAEMIFKGIRSIEKYIEAEQIFIVEITGRAIEDQSIDYNLPLDDWNMAVINNYGDFIIPPKYPSIYFDEETQTFLGNGKGGFKDRYSLDGKHISF